MKLKTLFYIMLACGIVLICTGIVVSVMALLGSTGTDSAIGIIGGADGPTAVFVVSRMMHSWPMGLILFGAAVIIAAVFLRLFTKSKN